MGWTWKDNLDIDEDEMDRREPAIKVIAERIHVIQQNREQSRFLQMAEDEEGRDPRWEYYQQVLDDAENDEEAAKVELEKYDTRQAALREVENIELRALEEQLGKLGARMMRPYEHWNEDERLMEYLERDR